MKTFLLALLSACLLAPFAAYAQTGSAILSGTVRDDSGNPLPGSTILVINTATGLQRFDVTAENGDYRVPSLPFGTYDVSAQIQGFAWQVRKGIRLDVGRSVTLDFNVRLSASGEEVEVPGRLPLIETTKSHIATVVTPEQLENLPSNARQFASLAILAPGTALIPNPDPTRFGALAISLNGSSGRNSNVIVDGGDNNDDVIGGINQLYPLESIAEFNFLTNRYEAEYGRASGGILNVVTKSGTNEFNGSLFTFFRDESLNALSKEEKNLDLTEPSSYNREQFGGSLGGPVLKDRAHFFLAIEREQLDVPVIVNTFGAAPEMDGPHNVPTRHNLYTAKFTADLNPTQYLVVRYGQQQSSTLYGANPWYAPDAWASLKSSLHSFLVSHTYLINPETVNEFLFQYADYKSAVDPFSDAPSELFVSTGIYFGQITAPQLNQQKKYQMKDDYSFDSSLFKGTHHMKTGLNYIHEPLVGGDLFFDQLPPLFIYSGSTRDSAIFEILQHGGSFSHDVPNNQYGIYVQDDWNVNGRLTLNLGVRYDYVTGFDLDQSQNPLYQELLEVPYDFPWLRAVKANPSGRLDNDTNNIAPRIGFAYDLKGDGRSVLRGGWGLHYDFPFTNGNILFAQAAGQFGLDYAFFDPNGIHNPDGTLFQVGDPLPPGAITDPFPTNEVASPDFVVPYTSQFSFGMSRQIGDASALDVDYVRVAGRDRYIRFRFNGMVNGEQILPGRGNPRFWYNGGYSDYNALNVTYRHQSMKGIQFQTSYTLSKITGNTLFGSDEWRIIPHVTCPDCTLDFTIGPGADPRMEASLDTDSRHRIVLTLIAQVPYGVYLSSIFRASTARPFNAVKFEDLNQDGFLETTVDPHPNSRRGRAFSQLDIRINKMFSIAGAEVEAILDIYNLLNAENPDRFNGIVDSEFFGVPLGFGDPRQAQLGIRIQF